MLAVLQDAKDKFRFNLTNFCVMPTHIHLLIKPAGGSNLSVIMHWIKTNSAKRWNYIHGSKDHLWGHRYFARAVKDTIEYEFIMDYIDQNAVTAGLAQTPAEWKASGAYYTARNIQGLIDKLPNTVQETKLLTPLPHIVSRLLPPAQLLRITKNLGAYYESIEYLYDLIYKIPMPGNSDTSLKLPFYLHYYSEIEDYFISEYDGDDSMWGEKRPRLMPEENSFQKISLSYLKNNNNIRLDFTWAAAVPAAKVSKRCQRVVPGTAAMRSVESQSAKRTS